MLYVPDYKSLRLELRAIAAFAAVWEAAAQDGAFLPGRLAFRYGRRMRA
jgi:hypothetical protein